MPTDQLTRAERIRLESLAQAISSAMPLRINSVAELFQRAEEIERWLKAARPDA